MDGAGPQPGRQREAAVALVDEQRQVLVLAVVAVVAAERLLAVHRVVGGIDVEDDLGGGVRRVRMNRSTR